MNNLLDRSFRSAARVRNNTSTAYSTTNSINNLIQINNTTLTNDNKINTYKGGERVVHNTQYI
jgi:hypothetical protein